MTYFDNQTHHSIIITPHTVPLIYPSLSFSTLCLHLCASSFLSPYHLLLLCLLHLVFNPLQSHWEVDRTPVWRLLLQRVIYHGHGCCSARPGSSHTAWGSIVPGPGPPSAWTFRRLWRSASQATRLPLTHARAYSVCGSHHWQRGPHHQECHQTDTVQVRYSDEDEDGCVMFVFPVLFMVLLTNSYISALTLLKL